MRTLRSVVAGAMVTGTLLAVPAAKSVDTPITGAKLKLSDVTQPGSARRKLVFVSKDPATPIPADGSAADPTANGGSLEIANTAGSGETAVVALPSGGWLRLPANPAKALRGWRYKEVVSDPPSDDYKIKVVLKQGYGGVILRVVVRDDRGSVIAYTLDEASQGSIGVRLTLGADRDCADFGGLVLVDLGEDLGGGVYRGAFAAKEAPAPADCGSPSGAFLGD